MTEPLSTAGLPADWMNALQWDDRGLITVVTQEVGTLKVLMVAWMNREALELTARTRQATYWSRSRSRLWRKGEESGHTQAVREIRADCDGDTLLLLVEQKGGIACHTGRHHCFFNRLDPRAGAKADPTSDADLDWTVVEPVLEARPGSSPAATDAASVTAGSPPAATDAAAVPAGSPPTPTGSSPGSGAA